MTIDKAGMEALARERWQVVQKAKALLPLASRLVDAYGGPTVLASYGDALGLALAGANRAWLVAGWCKGCGAPEAYWWT